MRTPNWWAALLAFIDANRARPREYGVWDCWQLTGGGVYVMTGTDYRALLPAYASLEAGIEVLESQGGPVEMLTGWFGESKHVSRANRGDIVLSDLGEGPAAGLCLGVKTVTVGQHGQELVPTLSGIAAWTV